MYHRSWLFVPANSEKKLGKAFQTGADVVVVDLEDSVPAEAKPEARDTAALWLGARRRMLVEHRPIGRWVRINALESQMWREDLAAVMPAAPDGIVLPKASGPEAVRKLAAEIYEFEQRHELPSGSTKILPLVSETPHAVMTIGSYVDAPHQRLFGFSWEVEQLSAALGASRKRDASGSWTGALQFARAQTLLTAHACGIAAIETFSSDFADEWGLRTAARAARADGFSGMLAIHPEQVAVINEAFTPGEEEIGEARRVVAAFESSPGEEVVQLDGRMIDQPQLKLAYQILGTAEGLEQANRTRESILRPA
ncbi:MAG: CoA ester lyase [Novosphingobium sp.]|nr:CoA ester lyase [Novosphingobium sp.]